MSRYLIIGAGISGLTAALSIKQKTPNAQIKLLDAGVEPGGLLRSICIDNLHFDFGTHIPELTDNDSLNKLIFPSNVKNKWQLLTELKVGNFFNDGLNEKSQFFNIPGNYHLFCNILNDLLLTESTNISDFENLESFLIARYGKTLTNNIFRPLIEKITACKMSQLTPESVSYYGLTRVSIGNEIISSNLKEINHLDDALSYTDDTKKARKSNWVYPGRQGVGEWINFMYQSCLEQGVSFIMEQRIEKLKRENNLYKVITTKDDEITAEHLIWTLPVYTGLDDMDSERIDTRSIAMYHFSSNTAPKTDRYYIYCHNADMYSYRLTFYDNFNHPNKDNIYRITVEVIFDQQPPESDIIRNELVSMGLFSSVDNLNLAGVIRINSGFPIPKVKEKIKKQNRFSNIKITHPDITFVGRGKPDLFFTKDVLTDVYNEINLNLQ